MHALLTGFWPYVDGFERAIDRQVARMPIKPLVQRFGRERIRNFFCEARLSVRDMKEEEGSHAELWRCGAEELGVVLGEEPTVRAVQDLLDHAWTDDPMRFFCWLAGTEYVAEELARFLCGSPRFLARFPGRRWSWGEAHLAEHDGPSHREIDEDLAQAYHKSSKPLEVRRDMSATIRRCIGLFWTAGQGVFDRLVADSLAEAAD